MSDQQPSLPSIGDAKPDIILFNSSIDENAFGSLVQNISENKKSDYLVLILVTLGGLPNSGYRIARFCQEFYEHFDLFVPSICKSAGTLVAVGAKKLYMTPFSELGPLDVQLVRPDELGERRSGLVNRSALESLGEHSIELFDSVLNSIKADRQIRYRLASQIATEVTIGLMSGVYSQITPTSIGEDFRDLQVAFAYGKRLSLKHKNILISNLRKLVHDYPSHDFVIDQDEAAKLFKRVEPIPDYLYRVVSSEPELFMQPRLKSPIIKMLTPPDEPNKPTAEPNNEDGDPDARSEGA